VPHSPHSFVDDLVADAPLRSFEEREQAEPQGMGPDHEEVRQERDDRQAAGEVRGSRGAEPAVAGGPLHLQPHLPNLPRQVARHLRGLVLQRPAHPFDRSEDQQEHQRRAEDR
jgi:hypothetical protein